jgi:hypothetical protein
VQEFIVPGQSGLGDEAGHPQSGQSRPGSGRPG